MGLSLGLGLGLGKGRGKPAPKLKDGLLAFYLDSGADQTAHGHNLAAQGSPSTATGPDGQTSAMLLPTNADFFTLGSGLLGTPPWSFSAFLLPDSGAWTVGDAISLFATSGGEPNILIGFDATNGIFVNGLNSGGTPADNVWLGILATCDASRNLTIFSQGIQVATGTMPAGAGGSGSSVASISGAAACRQSFTGFWSRALSAAEAVRLYNSGSALNPTL